MRWERASTTDEAKASRLCEQGWEPFAVTVVPGREYSWPSTTTHWFRRQVAQLPRPDTTEKSLGEHITDICDRDRDPLR